MGLRSHMLKHQNRTYTHGKYTFTYDEIENVYVCNKCNSKCIRLDELKEHLEVHDDKYCCSFCDKKYTDTIEFAKHLYSHETFYRCQKCDYKVEELENLLKHFKTSHKTKKVKYTCKSKNCGQQFRYIYLLNEHESKHKKGLKYKCVVCEKKFKFLWYLISHQKHIHTVTTGRNYRRACTICKQMFYNKEKFRIHKKIIHKIEREYPCKVCGKKFATFDKLKVHRRRHIAEQSHKCNYCEKVFVCSAHLKKHEMSHTENNKFVCQYCGQTFSPAYGLTHERLHVNGTPYKCRCTKSFTSRHELYFHNRYCNNIPIQS